MLRTSAIAAELYLGPAQAPSPCPDARIVYIGMDDQMEGELKHRCATATIVCVGLALVTGCSFPPAASPSSQDAGIAIAPEFEAFVREHDLMPAAGPPLQPPVTEGAVTRQLFLAMELQYDPGASPDRQVSLSPLGIRLGLSEPPVPPPAQPNGSYFPSSGHTIYAGFLQRYESLGGEALLGAPIAEVKFQGGKIFQYFENVGIYREQDAPPSQAGLLALGAASKPELDLKGLEDIRVVLPPAIVFQPFEGFIERLGAESLFGAPLTEPYLARDGALEQAYERAVIYSPESNPEQAHLRPLGLDLGPPSPPVPPVDDPGALYIPKYGHNIRWSFVDFYRNHNGDEILGLPLEEAKLSEGLLSQRYENGILAYHYDLPPEHAFQLAPLGRRYLGESPGAAYRAPAPTPPSLGPRIAATPPSADKGVRIESWPLYSVFASGQQQIIYIEVRTGAGEPLAGVTPVIAIYRQDSELYPPLGATDSQGMTSISLSPIDFSPGEIVNYEVVVTGEEGYGYAWGQFAVLLGTPWP